MRVSRLPLALALMLGLCAPSTNALATASPARQFKHLTLTAVSGRPFTLSYPASWHALKPRNYIFTFDKVLAYVGNIPLPYPCTGPHHRSCSFFPHAPLPPSGVVLNIVSNVAPRPPGSPRRLSGNLKLFGLSGRKVRSALGPARLWIEPHRSPGNPQIDARTLVIIIARNGLPNAWLIVTARLRAPNLRAHQQQIIGIVSSLHND